MAKILLADESITIQKVVNLVLSEEGHEIKAATSGSDVLGALSSFGPDIVLMDIKLPDEGGYEVVKKIKGAPATAHIPVLLMAGAFEPADEASLATSGADGSITKPFEAKDLLEKVRSLLAGERAAPAPAESAAETVEPVAEAEPLVEEVAETVEAAEAVEEEAVEVVAADEEEDLWDLGEVEGAAEPEAVETVEAVAEEVAVAPVGVSPQAAPGPAELADAVTDALTEQIEGLVGSVDLKGLLLEALGPGIKDTVEKILWEVTPELTERLIREAVTESMGSLNKELENIVWETVPELAESIIRKEIEKIRAES
jgi:CheY-like chemotaxis protein